MVWCGRVATQQGSSSFGIRSKSFSMLPFLVLHICILLCAFMYCRHCTVHYKCLSEYGFPSATMPPRPFAYTIIAPHWLPCFNCNDFRIRLSSQHRRETSFLGPHKAKAKIDIATYCFALCAIVWLRRLNQPTCGIAERCCEPWCFCRKRHHRCCLRIIVLSERVTFGNARVTFDLYYILLVLLLLQIPLTRRWRCVCVGNLVYPKITSRIGLLGLSCNGAPCKNIFTCVISMMMLMTIQIQIQYIHDVLYYKTLLLKSMG